MATRLAHDPQLPPALILKVLGAICFSRYIVGSSVARGAVDRHGADLDPGTLLEGGASRKAEQSATAVGVDQVLGTSFLSPRYHVVHHVR